MDTDEFNKIQKYIKNPRDIGLWETTFSLSFTISPVENENPFIQYLNKYAPTQVVQNSQNHVIASFDYSPYNILQKLCQINMNLSPSFLFNPEKTDLDIEYDNIILDIFKIYKIEYHGGFLFIDGKIFFSSQIPTMYNHTFKILSLHQSLNSKVSDILNKINYAVFQNEIKIYAPKETLYIPYFFYVNLISITAFNNSQELNYFQTAYNHFNNHQYEDSIRLLGKAFESTISRIHETLFREDSSSISSLGKMINSIENNVKTLSSQNSNSSEVENELKPSKRIFYKCTELENNTSLSVCEAILAFRKLAQELQKEESKTDIIESMIFPKDIKEYIETLTSLRNTISHHNGAYLTYNDSIKMLFAYIQVLLWWEDSCKKISSWDDDKEKVIQDFIELLNS